MSTLILVRHGQSIYNLENRFTGILDVGLTDLGKEEAKIAGFKIKNVKFDYAYTSMLKRAQESLEIILNILQQKNTIILNNIAFNERNYGSLQGLDKNEIIAKFGTKQVEIWRRSYDICPPDGESLKDTYNRIAPYFKNEVEPKLLANKNILIVAHGNSLRALVMYLERISKENISALNFPTGISRQYVFDDDLKILEMKYL